MFRKILIANRAEIACRVAATARRLGIRTVAVYSDADANARHVQACDEAVAIGPGPARQSYLRGEVIIAAALATGAEAIHPGYGFLSENAAFAQACADAGLVFIGPPPAAIRAMGLKSQAKQLMERAGVPLVPGYHGIDQDPDLLAREAARIGFPVLIKASAGGGGKGMRVVEQATEFAAALASCQREAQASFGDAAVLIERYVTRPRHIEVQIFADTHGQCVHLFERDCSVQRRHQKVLEEAPAPGLSAERRAEMGAAAVAAASAVGYVGAGTVEFIAEPTPDGDLRFFFMEMNTRLQVEHPVTEAITGLDLVEWQLRVASNEPLPLAQSELTLSGHAIEARICAENVDAGFLPATGQLDHVRWPTHTAFAVQRDLPRVDTGFGAGDTVSPYYDSMIAKLIVWGKDRDQALARLDAALAATQLLGVHTNVAFLRRVVGSHSFATADLDTALIERERSVLFAQPALASETVIAATLAHLLLTESKQTAEAAASASAAPRDPWSCPSSWRLQGPAERSFELNIAGVQVAVLLKAPTGWRSGMASCPWQSGGQLVTSAGSFDAQWWVRPDGGIDLALDGARQALHVVAHADKFVVFTQHGVGTAQLLPLWVPTATSVGAEAGLTAPMPGKLLAYMVPPGAVVQVGQALAVMEAMKMEHTVHAPRAGVVEAYCFAVGDQVAEGAELLRLMDA